MHPDLFNRGSPVMALRRGLERNRLWLLKNSIFAKTAEIWDIENVYQNGDLRS